MASLDSPNEHLLDLLALQECGRWGSPNDDDLEPAAVFDYLYHGCIVTFRRCAEGEDPLKLAHSIVCGWMPALALSRQQLGGDSIVYNGGFEEWSAEGPSGWERLWSDGLGALTGGVFRDNEERREGASSLRLENRGQAERSRLSQDITAGPTLAPGRQYRVSLWVRAEGIRRVNRFEIASFSRSAQRLAAWEIEVPAESKNWEQASTLFRLPRGTAKLRFTLGLEGAGSLWIDGLRLESIGVDSQVSLVANPEPPADEELFQRWIELYHGQGRRFLMYGRLERPPILVVAAVLVGRKRFPAVFHNMFSAPDGSRAIIMVNITDDEQSGRLLLASGSEPIRLAPREIKLIELAERSP